MDSSLSVFCILELIELPLVVHHWQPSYVIVEKYHYYTILFFLFQASRDLVCFLQLDHVNVYYGQDYRSKYKAPTDYCLALKVGVCESGFQTR